MIILKCALGAILAVAVAVVPAGRAQTSAPIVLLELFTSQGCSSCPPADALLPSFIARRDVVALSLPVDYWDRLGWKDTFAKPEFTRRQYEYARRRGDRGVYTPQIVVSGMSHAVGSAKGDVEHAIAAAQRELESTPVAMDARFGPKGLTINIGMAPKTLKLDGARVLLAIVQREGRVAVKRGENADRQLSYHNITRSLLTVDEWQGTVASWTIPASRLETEGAQSVVVFVQASSGGPIVAVSQCEIASASREAQ